MHARRLTGASLAQDRSFYLRLTGRANLLFFARLRHGNEQEAARDVDSLVEELELAEIVAERVDRCSSGMVPSRVGEMFSSMLPFLLTRSTNAWIIWVLE